jgi:hypothetical protein
MPSHLLGILKHDESSEPSLNLPPISFLAGFESSQAYSSITSIKAPERIEAISTSIFGFLDALRRGT